MHHLPLLAHDDHFAETIRRSTGQSLLAEGIGTLQVNVGKVCNQACRHCHVDAGPARTESMTEAVALQCLEVLRRFNIPVLDITGGAPELNPHFRTLVREGRRLGATVMVRHNLTVQDSPGQHDLPQFFAEAGCVLFSSLPHYTAETTDRQRGGGTFDGSVRALRALNAVGYGTGRSDLTITLVHNPVGAFLPGSQRDLEADFRRVLSASHGVTFDRLVSLANMPIERFKAWLVRTGQLSAYEAKLEGQFNPGTVPGLMCRTMLSVGYDGQLYDCDFNQMLGLTVTGGPTTLASLLDEGEAKLLQRSIVTGRHCFGCTAGSGSSCGGAIA